METLEQGVNYVQKLTIKKSKHNLFITDRTYFTPCSSVSVVNFEQVNAGWKSNNLRQWSELEN